MVFVRIEFTSNRIYAVDSLIYKIIEKNSYNKN